MKFCSTFFFEHGAFPGALFSLYKAYIYKGLQIITCMCVKGIILALSLSVLLSRGWPPFTVLWRHSRWAMLSVPSLEMKILLMSQRLVMNFKHFLKNFVSMELEVDVWSTCQKGFRVFSFVPKFASEGDKFWHLSEAKFGTKMMSDVVRFPHFIT